MDKKQIIKQLREARDRITTGIKIVYYADEVDDLDELVKGMALIEEGSSSVSALHEELYIVRARLELDKEAGRAK